jgi:biopolymer transport protein ExbD
MAMSVGSIRGVKSDINVTPLVDVVLVLLIIFMVITPLLQVGYQVSVPPEVKSAAPPPTSADQIIVSLSRDGHMYINKDLVPAARFPSRLAETMRNREAKIVFFAAHGDLAFDQVADFLDLCHNNGAEKLGIVLEDLSVTPAAASAVGITGG